MANSLAYTIFRDKREPWQKRECLINYFKENDKYELLKVVRDTSECYRLRIRCIPALIGLYVYEQELIKIAENKSDDWMVKCKIIQLLANKYQERIRKIAINDNNFHVCCAAIDVLIFNDKNKQCVVEIFNKCNELHIKAHCERKLLEFKKYDKTVEVEL